MIAAQHKNDIITTRDTKQEKILRWEAIRFQDLFETVSIWKVTNVTWNGVPYGRPCDSKSFIPILCSGWWNDEMLSDAERVTGTCGGLDLAFKLSVRYCGA